MPKVVVRAERRAMLVRVTWDLIVADGLAAVTLRRVAEAAGFANGAIKPYFATKSDLMDAAYVMAFDNTMARMDVAVRDLRGLAALRRVCWEIMPLDDERRVEARVVIAFWEATVANPSITAIARSTSEDLMARIVTHLREARELGEVTTGPDEDEAVVDELFWMMMGLQSMCWIMPGAAGPERQRAVLDRVLATLAAPRPALAGSSARG